MNYQTHGNKIIDVLKANEGRCSIEDIQNAGVMNSALIRETLRLLVHTKQIVMDQGDTYSLPGTPPAQSKRTSDSAPPAPAPRQKDPPKPVGGTEHAEPMVACSRCQMEHPRSHYLRSGPGRNFSRCAACRKLPPLKAKSAPAPKPAPPTPAAEPHVLVEKHAAVGKTTVLADPLAARGIIDDRLPVTSFEQLADRWSGRVMFKPGPRVREKLELLVASGFYGNSISEAAERLMCDSILRLMTSGILKPSGDNDNER